MERDHFLCLIYQRTKLDIYITNSLTQRPKVDIFLHLDVFIIFMSRPEFDLAP
jgi:hypothetical protein